MTEDTKKDSADEIIKRSIELFGLTPKEISDKNVEWMQKKGLKSRSGDIKPQITKHSKPVPKYSWLSNIIKRLGMQQSV